ncbi:MAG: tetratricopeptide repeat protein [Bryobacteraceae bacterium]
MGNARIFGFATASFVLECGLWAFASLPAAILGHIVVSTALGAAAFRAARAGRDYTLPSLLGLFTTATGPFGPFGVLVCIALGRRYARTAQPVETWIEELMPSANDGEKRRPSPRADSVLDSASDITALIDVLEMGDELQKQAAVSLVTRSFRPSLAPVLRRALSDPSNAIRVQAATAMARIEGGFLERVMELDTALEAAPGDPEKMEAVARLYDDYAFTGILDPVRELENQRQAIRHYRRVLEISPGNSAVRLALGRLLVRARQWEEADRWLSGAGEEGALWRLETLARLGRYAELETVARSVQHRATDELLPIPLRESLALWAGGRAA